jgi:Lon protease-like protein
MAMTASDPKTTARAPVLPRHIPLFPLREAILLPRGRLPLNIFEPRYLAMTEHALSAGRIIGMVRPRHDDDVNPAVYDIGCAGRITSFMETEDGRFLITLTGVSRFRLKSEALSDGGFRLVEVDWSRYALDLYADQDENPALRERVLELLVDYLQEVGLKADWDSIEGASAETLINSVAMACPFEPDEKQAILEAPTLHDRGQTLAALMQMAVAEQRGDLDERMERMQ